MIRNRDVQEIAAVPGSLAKHVAPASRPIVVADDSEGMIAEAKRPFHRKQRSVCWKKSDTAVLRRRNTN